MRLFIALRPGPATRAALHTLMGGVAGARWQDDEQLHVTLAFLGEVEPIDADALHGALGAVHAPPVDLFCAGTGEFERKGVAHSLWVGVRPAEPLTALSAKVTQAARRCGLRPEARAFIPHITIARLNRASGATAPFHVAHGDFSTPAERIDAFILYESLPGTGGSRYIAHARYPLA